MLYLPPKYDYGRDAKNGMSLFETQTKLFMFFLPGLTITGVTGVNIATITAGHVLDAMCFLLGEFAFLTAQAKCNFPVVNTPFHTEPVTNTAFDAFAVQGELESGATATFNMFSTTPETATSFTWTITGDKGSLKFEGGFINIQMDPPTLYRQGSDGQGKSTGLTADVYGERDKTKDVRWKAVEVDEPIAYGQVGELYDAFANGEKVKGCLVDFEGAALRHRMLDACFKSARDGTRETYRK